MSKEVYWNLLNKELLLEFVEWLRTYSPITFRYLVEQFLKTKEK
jgi:hypothetical protein